MYAQIDDQGNSFLLLDEIQDHRKDGTALTEQDAYVYRGHNKHRKPTTKGWELLVAWKDGSNSWVKLKDIKDSNPVEVAEYAVANRIQDEPAFAWWVKPVLRRRNRIISKVKKKYWRTTHKYGIRVPKSVSVGNLWQAHHREPPRFQHGQQNCHFAEENEGCNPHHCQSSLRLSHPSDYTRHSQPLKFVLGEPFQTCQTSHRDVCHCRNAPGPKKFGKDRLKMG